MPGEKERQLVDVLDQRCRGARPGAPGAPRRAPAARSCAGRRLARPRCRRTSARGGAPGQPEQTSRTRCPRAASRPKISNRWISAPPAWGFSQVLPVDQQDVHEAGRQRPAGDAVEHAVDEPRRARAAEPVGQPHRLVDRHLGRHLARAAARGCRAGGCSAPPPPSGSAASSPRRARPRRRGTRPSATTPLGQRLRAVQHPRLGTGEPRRAAGDARHRRIALQLPGVEQLQRPGPALGLNPEHRRARSCATTSAACERRRRRLVPLVSRAPAGPRPPPAAAYPR